MKESAIERVSWPGAWQGALSAMLGYLAVFLGAGIGGALCHAVRPSLRAANAVADRARQLQADHGNKNFPMVDAVVAAFRAERRLPVITCDAKWPAMDEVEVETLSPASAGG